MSTPEQIRPCRYCRELKSIAVWCNSPKCAERVAAAQAESPEERWQMLLGVRSASGTPEPTTTETP